MCAYGDMSPICFHDGWMNCILLGFNHFGHLLFRRRESTDVEDLFIAHISGMDTLARGLRNVAKLIEVIN